MDEALDRKLDTTRSAETTPAMRVAASPRSQPYLLQFVRVRRRGASLRISSRPHLAVGSRGLSTRLLRTGGVRGVSTRDTRPRASTVSLPG
jgi:hypothetical protein